MCPSKPYRNMRSRDKIKARLMQTETVCPICGRALDWSLGWWVDPADGVRKRHPMSVELDEIVPFGVGGNPNDIDNVQAVHRICNQKKGKKRGYTLRRTMPKKEDFPQSVAL